MCGGQVRGRKDSDMSSPEEVGLHKEAESGGPCSKEGERAPRSPAGCILKHSPGGRASGFQQLLVRPTRLLHGSPDHLLGRTQVGFDRGWKMRNEKREHRTVASNAIASETMGR